MPLFQSESKCETILMKMALISMKMKLHAKINFHMKGFVLRLVLKQRHKGTRKWPIQMLFSSLKWGIRKRNKHNGKSHSFWLARFDGKMSFQFPRVFPLVSERSVWHNESTHCLPLRFLPNAILCMLAA